jgi:TonB family protein
MNSIFYYLITSSWLLLLLTLGYFCLLQNQKLLRFTRLYLLASLLLCLLHPFLSEISNLLPDSFVTAGTLPLTQAEQYLPELVLSSQSITNSFSVSSLLLWLYLSGCGISLLLFFVRLAKLYKILQRLSFQLTPERYLLAHTEGQQPTFSFFSYLVINKAHTLTTEEYELVLLHEKVHARQLHSADVLLAELVQVVLWFHPGIHMLNKALRQTHEHLADAAVIKESSSETIYIALMARQGLAAAGLPFTSNFFQSFTINRIRMIRKHTLPTSKWRIAASLLLAASLATFIACDKQEDGLSDPKLVSPPPAAAEAPDAPAVATPDESGIYENPEVVAQPEGGMQALYKHMYDNIRYPKEAITNEVEGITYVKFVIDERGVVESAETVEGRQLNYGLDEEAVRAVKNTVWTPAKQDGKLVKQQLILPVKFKLKDDSEQKSVKKQTTVLFQGMLKTPPQEGC